MAAETPGGVAALRRLPFLDGVEEPVLGRLAARARWMSLQAGQLVVDAGDASDEVFFVLDGALRVILRSTAGHELILGDVAAGEMFGELAAIDGAGRSASVTALLRTQLAAVPGPAFLEAVLASPVAGLRLLRLLVARLRAKDERILESVVLPLRHRLAAELLRLSRDRGNGERAVSPPPPQHVLAARIGVRRETVSRELASLARLGLIRHGRGAIVLVQPDRLRAEIEARLREGAG